MEEEEGQALAEERRIFFRFGLHANTPERIVQLRELKKKGKKKKRIIQVRGMEQRGEGGEG